MQAPDPIFIYKAGLKNLVDVAILWHLALCGLTGCGLPDLCEALRANENTLRASLTRLETLKLVVPCRNRDLVGHPLRWVCSRIGYRLMTGHLRAEEKARSGGQLPMGDEIIQKS